jgi:hypothetical protein
VRRLAAVACACAASLLVSRPSAQGPTPDPVLTHHNDTARSGVNAGERTLTPTNVAATLHRIGGFHVDGQVYAQPLFMPNVFVNGTPHDVVFIATMRNYVYAYDANASNPSEAAPLWMVGPSQIGDPVPFNFRHLIFQEIGYNVHDSFGITSTPVLDQSDGALWVVAKVLKQPTGMGPERFMTTHRLHKLSIADGHAMHPWVEIKATIAGTGDQSSSGQLTFDPDLHLQRAALLLSKGFVYVAFGAHQDTPGFHGWLFRFTANDPSEESMKVVCMTKNGKEAGIWQAGGGPAADASGNVYVITGNGSYDPSNEEYGMAFVRFTKDLDSPVTLSPSRPLFGSRGFLNLLDADLGSSGPVLVSDSLIVGGGKPGRMYLVESSSTALKQLDDPQITKKLGWPFFLPIGFYHIHGVPVAWHASDKTRVFVWPEKTPILALSVDTSAGQPRLSACPKGTSSCRSSVMAPPHSMPGGMLSLSVDGTDDSTAILWASRPLHDDAFLDDVPGVLYAFDPKNLVTPIWSNEGDAYLFAKYAPPTVANGHVYLPTFSGRVDVYGL